MFSRSIGNLTSELPTIFCILKFVNWTLKFNFWIILAYFLAAVFDCSSFLAPVQTILPDEKTKAVVLGSLSLIITAANLLGLYSAFLACKAIVFKFNWQFRFTVETIFCKVGFCCFMSMLKISL